MGLIDGVDHAVVTVRDLDAAARAFERLGFALTPRGRHTRLGTHNHTMMFADRLTYFELIAVESPGPNTAFYESFLARREGVSSLALKSGDARVVAAALAGEPFRAGAAIDFARAVELPGGPREARFTVTHFDPGATPGARAFVCQQHTPDVVWRPDMLRHANGATALKSVLIVVADVAAAAERWGRLFGVAPAVDPEEAVVPTATAAVILLAPAAFRRRFPAEAALAALEPPFCAGLGFAVADRAATATWFRTKPIPFRDPGRGGPLVVASAEACGAILMFG
jgi:hypothetical protein